MVYDQIQATYRNNEKQFAILLDPDKFSGKSMDQLKTTFNEVSPDIILVGGSLISTNTFDFINKIKAFTNIPITIFPGSSSQYTANADAILFLSLLSGRNPEFLISHHVASAPLIKANNTETIPTGYILIDGGRITSVQYISQTQAIPSDKSDIAIATALAGQYLGMKLIYMDAGSGASVPIPQKMIKEVKSQIDIPLMIGGGLNSYQKIKEACQAGADIIVVGNALEKDISLLKSFHAAVKSS